MTDDLVVYAAQPAAALLEEPCGSELERRLHDGGEVDSHIHDSLHGLARFERLVPAATVRATGPKHDDDTEVRQARTRATCVASIPAVSEFVFDSWEEIEARVNVVSGSPFALAYRCGLGCGVNDPLRLENSPHGRARTAL